MTRHSPPPAWKLPEGVNPSLWQYANTPRLATEEDEYFEGHPLFRFDSEVLADRFQTPAPLVDLGCGAGRHSLQFAARGFPVVAVDLSQSMLREVDRKARQAGTPLAPVQANLCRLTCFAEESFHYAISMFSTLGMIRGSAARRKALGEAYRILRPGGRLALHAHNIWLNLKDPQGRSWLAGQVWARARRSPNFGDRRMTYRGVSNMEVHLFTWRELSNDLKAAGFRIDEVLAIDEINAQPIARPWLLPTIRAGGWIVFASK